jgi:hypothetical protein
MDPTAISERGDPSRGMGLPRTPYETQHEVGSWVQPKPTHVPDTALLLLAEGAVEVEEVAHAAIAHVLLKHHYQLAVV